MKGQVSHKDCKQPSWTFKGCPIWRSLSGGLGGNQPGDLDMKVLVDNLLLSSGSVPIKI